MKILQCSASKLSSTIILLTWLLLINPMMLISNVHGAHNHECTCDVEKDIDHNKPLATKYKIGAIISILLASAIGVSIPLLGKIIPALSPKKDIFFIIKVFAAGVILATGFIHILPDAFSDLTSPCLKDNPWKNFPFTGFIAMMSAILTLMVDTLATGYYSRLQLNKSHPTNGSDIEQISGHQHMHSHYGSTMVADSSTENSLDLIRYQVISQVLELGIVVHSVIIGIAVGASQSPSTIKPLVAALTFHQFFEGMGLGGTIAQAKLKGRAIVTMGLFFALTTPVGIGIGMGISTVYSETSSTALIVQGCLNAASSGILIYMSLVDLLAADFMSSKMQNNAKLQFASYISLLLGAGSMSLLAKWA